MLDNLIKFLLTKQRMDRLGVRQTTQEDLDQLIPIIEFMCEPQHKGVLIEPQPAYKHIAEWWKRVPAKLPVNKTSPRDAFGAVAMTSKDCVPLLDGMGLGYMMLSAADLHVRTDGLRNMEVRSGPTYNAGSQHSSDQLGKDYPTYPMPAIKFHNPWVIKTRPGYSTLFIPPMNHTTEDRFRCMAAVVDTDTYPKQINFPGLWFAKNYDGTVKAGTPLVTAIPFRRADVPRELLIRTITAAEQFEINRMSHVQNARSGFYTKELRESRK